MSNSPFTDNKSILTYPLIISGDWGLEDDAAFCWLHVPPQRKGIFVTDEHTQNNWSVPRHCEVLRQITRGRRIDRQNLVLDASAFRREGTSLTNIARQFHLEGFTFNPSTKDKDVSIELVKRLLKAEKLFISRKCVKLIEALKNWEWDQHEPDILAALRYGVHHIFKRRLTTLFDGMSSLDVSFSRVSGEVNQLTDEGKRRIIRPKNRTFSWDYENGMPK